MTRLRIGVVGCGIAGMASAMYLARDGHAVTVFDRFTEPQPLGAGLLLQPTGQAVLRDLGLLETVAAGAARIDHLDSRNRQGRRVLDLPYALASHGTGLGAHRSRLFAAMWSGVQAQPIEVCFGATVSALEDDGRRVVLDGGRSFDFDLVVIAAGVHTPLRRYFIIARDQTYPWGCLWTTVQLPEGHPGQVLQQRVDGARIMIGLLPVGRGEAALFWSLRNDRVEQWRARPLTEWKAQLTAVWPEAAPALDAITDHAQLTHAMYRDVALHDPIHGAAIAIGDVAHATSPQLGQGANLALLDAAVLAACLREHSPDVAFMNYAGLRRAQHAYYRWSSRLLTPFFQADTAWLGWLRDMILPATHRLPWARRRMVDTLAGVASGLFSDIDLTAQLPVLERVTASESAR